MALAWIGIFAGGGCGAVSRPPERPQVTVERVELVAAEDGGGELRIEVAAVNPNAGEVRGVAVDWELSVDEVTRARGRADGTLALPARGRAAGRFVGRVKPGAMARIQAARGAGGLRVDGAIHWQSAGGDVATPFAWDEAPAAAQGSAGARGPAAVSPFASAAR